MDTTQRQRDAVDGSPALSSVASSRVRRTSDRVYDELASAIRDLRLKPGQALSETELAKQLGVSRTPLREAISRLVENGLLHVAPQVGTRVAAISLEQVVQAQFVREHLEVGAFVVACGLPVRDVSALQAKITEQRAALRARDYDAFFRADEALHAAIFDVAGYAGAWDAMQRTKVQLDRIRHLTSERETMRDLIAEHVAIVKALKDGDVEAGRPVLQHHARRVLEYAPDLHSRFPEYFES